MAELFSVAKCLLLPANASQPVEVGVLQEVSLDFSIETKDLQGPNRYPVLTVQGKGSISGKASAARFNAETISAILGATKTTGAKLLGNLVTTIPATPYTVTPVPPNSGTMSQDGGVLFVGTSELTNVPATRVTGTPTTGQYSYASGVYTFAAADTTKQVSIDFEYSITSGHTIAITNPVLGNAYPFQLWAKTVIQGKEVVIKAVNVVAEKYSLDFKLGEFAIPDFDFKLYPDGAGNILSIYTLE